MVIDYVLNNKTEYNLYSKFRGETFQTTICIQFSVSFGPKRRFRAFVPVIKSYIKKRLNF